MRKIPYKIPDWGVGLAVTVIMLLVYFTEWSPFRLLEYKTYDFRMELRKKKPSIPLVILSIDDESITKLGRWPWPRAIIAESVNRLHDAGARIVGVSILYTEADKNDGLLAMKDVKTLIEKDSGNLKDPRMVPIYDAVVESMQSLDNDGILADSISTANNVVLPMSFVLGEPLSIGDATSSDKGKLPDYIVRNSIKAASGVPYLTAQSVFSPIALFAEKAAGLGHININPSEDGVLRKESLLISYGGRLYPSFPLQIVLKYLNYDIKDINVADGVRVKKLFIPTDGRKEMFISYAGKYRTFPYQSFFDFINNKIPAEYFRDKIVLIGLDATGIATLAVTPLTGSFPTVEAAANVIENLLNGNHVVRPLWARYLELVAMLLFGAFVSIFITRLKAGMSAYITSGMFVAWNVFGVYLFASSGYWLKIAYPSSLLLLGYLVVMSKRYFLTEKKTELMEADSIETNKMLGLSFQGQGMLDMAFEKFRKCPIEDNAIKELLYNLGLDFERKRMFNKAIAVYEHILGVGPYKDLNDKIKKLRQAGETVILGSSRKEGTVILENAETKPTLGRYEVIREIGRGAMGVVYLGKDPTIDREVAIKTLRYEELDEDMIDEIKDRFFREAKAAGKLNHKNIVKVFDAAAEHDIAYMAMELLDGSDLVKYCAKDSRLSFGEVLRVVTSVADALDYAHSKGVVHRDIKPANIMMLKNKELRVTDFGIARVMESSKTQTGMVLGTPSYMAPEQIAGKKVDGRADLFSLGVVFFELLVGERPFKGDSIATLMYNITSVPAPNIKEFDPRIPSCIVAIINKMLTKSADDRYQSGREVVEDINKCKRTLVKPTITQQMPEGHLDSQKLSEPKKPAEPK
ncbi:MAG: CHASE2 domain-containing protein [Nitrospirae bacterium]|nr:CHASE2 domain-containing protein [Nitrospirota bacterium]